MLPATPDKDCFCFFCVPTGGIFTFNSATSLVPTLYSCREVLQTPPWCLCSLYSFFKEPGPCRVFSSPSPLSSITATPGAPPVKGRVRSLRLACVCCLSGRGRWPGVPWRRAMFTVSLMATVMSRTIVAISGFFYTTKTRRVGAI